MSNIQPFFGTELGEPSDVYCKNIVLDGVGIGTTWNVGTSISASPNPVFKTEPTVVVISPNGGSGTGMEVTLTIRPSYASTNNQATATTFTTFSMSITNAGSNYVAGDTLNITDAQLLTALSGQGWTTAAFAGVIGNKLDFKLGNNVTIVENEAFTNANGGGRADVTRGETGWQFSVGAANPGLNATVNLIIPAKSDTSSNQID